jgi:hypothetical protein
LVPGISAAAEPVDLGVAGTLSGQLRDMAQVSNRSGYTFQVAMRGVHYDGQLERTVVETTGEKKYTIWMALRGFRVTIDRTDIAGQPGRAACGPMDIVLGSQRELWIAFDMHSELNEVGEVQLVLEQTRFQLPPDNWALGNPQWVQTSGFGMTQANVVNGIHRGLSENRERIVQHVINAGPTIFTQAASLSDRLPPLAPQPEGGPSGQASNGTLLGQLSRP